MPNARLARLLSGGAGRFVERWVPAESAGHTEDSARVDEALSVETAGAESPASARSGTLRRVAVPVIVLVVLAAALTAVVTVGARPEPERAPPLPAVAGTPQSRAAGRPPDPAPRAELVVSVVGKVRKPGLVRLPVGARVADAIKAVGGARRGVDLTTLNLARKLADGEQIYVGIPIPAAVLMPDTGGGAAPAKVSLNSASQEQLEALPGVGEVTAKRILEWRAQHGGFTSVEQLREIEGIGERRFAGLRDQVTVG